MTWHFGVIKRDGVFCLEEIYSLKEENDAWTSKLSIIGESKEEFLKTLDMIRRDVEKGYYEEDGNILNFKRWEDLR